MQHISEEINVHFEMYFVHNFNFYIKKWENSLFSKNRAVHDINSWISPDSCYGSTQFNSQRRHANKFQVQDISALKFAGM